VLRRRFIWGGYGAIGKRGRREGWQMKMFARTLFALPLFAVFVGCGMEAGTMEVNLENVTKAKIRALFDQSNRGPFADGPVGAPEIGLNETDCQDAWGRPIVFLKQGNVLRVTSLGADGVTATQDDIIMTFSW